MLASINMSFKANRSPKIQLPLQIAAYVKPLLFVNVIY